MTHLIDIVSNINSKAVINLSALDQQMYTIKTASLVKNVFTK